MPTDHQPEVSFKDVIDARGDPERQTRVSLDLLIQDAGDRPVGFLIGTETLERLVKERGLGWLPFRACTADRGELALLVVLGAPLKLVQRVARLDDQRAFLFDGSETQGQLELHRLDVKPEPLGGFDSQSLRAALERYLCARCTFRMPPRSFAESLMAQAAGEPVETWLTAG